MTEPKTTGYSPWKSPITSNLIASGAVRFDAQVELKGAEITKTAGESAGIFVARGDGPSSGVTRAVMEREGWSPKQ